MFVTRRNVELGENLVDLCQRYEQHFGDEIDHIWSVLKADNKKGGDCVVRI